MRVLRATALCASVLALAVLCAGQETGCESGADLAPCGEGCINARFCNGGECLTTDPLKKGDKCTAGGQAGTCDADGGTCAPPADDDYGDDDYGNDPA